MILYRKHILLVAIIYFGTNLKVWAQVDLLLLRPKTSILIYPDTIIEKEEANRIFRPYEGFSVVTDGNANLLFYGDGVDFNTNAHTWMFGSEAIPLKSGSSSAQQVAIIQKNKNSNSFTFLALNQFDTPGELFMGEINLLLNNGLGDVEVNSITKIGDNLTEQMYVIQHPCKGVWVIVHERGSNKFITFQIYDSEVLKIKETFIGSPIEFNSNGNVNYVETGSIIASKKNKIVNLFGTGIFEIYDFDPFSGELFNPKIIYNRNEREIFYTGIFSPNDSLFYAYSPNGWIGKYSVYPSNSDQMRLTERKLELGAINGISGFYKAIDSKIYFTSLSLDHSLGVINNPDIPNSDIDFDPNGVRLRNQVNSKSFPAPVVMETQPIIDFLDSTMSACTVSELSVSTTTTYDSIVWNTGEKTSIILPETSGLYKAKIYRDGCAYEDSIQVEINHSIQQDSIYICENDSLEYKGQFYSAYETIIDTLLSAEGCLNIKEIKILETEAIKLDAVIGICEGAIYTDLEGNTYGEGDVFTTIKSSSMSCDTVIRNTIKALPLPKPIIEGQQVLCFGNKTDLFLSQDYEEYMWSNQDSTRSIRVGEGVFDVLVKDSLGCESTSRVTIIERPEWLIDVLDAIDVEGSYLLQVNGDLERMESWSISPNEELFLLAGDRLLADGKAAPGFYSLALKDDIGCLTSTIFEIEAHQKEELMQSNVLNIQANNAINRVWLPRVPEGMTLQHVGIYDRWGNEVFATTDESESWDGRFSGQIVSTGNYVYVLKLINDKGVEQAYVGSIMVIGGE